MGGICSFGYGSKDEDGRCSVGEFISYHIEHWLRIATTDKTPEEYCDSEDMKYER